MKRLLAGRDISSMPVVPFVFLIVLGSPFPLVVFVFYLLVRDYGLLTLILRIGSLIWLIVYLGFFFSNVSLVNSGMNFLCGVIALGSYCFLASSAFEISLKPLRVIALVILGAPASIVTMTGILSLMFDADASTYKKEQMRPDLVCKMSSYGIVGAGGDRIRLYKSWPAIPFLERNVGGDSSNDADPSIKMSSCADLLNRYDDRK
jgi:hypothetical protein